MSLAEPTTTPERLLALPPTFGATRAALHQVASDVVSPARREATGRIGLVPTPGGFGTPPFGDGPLQVRVEGIELVVVEPGGERRAPLTSLRAAGELVGDLVPGAGALPDEPLAVDSEAAGRLADLYAIGAALLERLRSEATEADGASEATLWPEHFDVAIEMGAEALGRRANYGVSPGDDEHPEPYVYVGPWGSPPGDELWNASGFTGAELGYSELAASGDPLGLALEFCLTRRRALDSVEG